MESLFIKLSDYVYISISKNWLLRLVLWSRVTYIRYTWYLNGTYEHFTVGSHGLMVIVLDL